MNILVINASPKGVKSETLRITEAFLSGINQKAKRIDIINCDIKPCKGCYKCWKKDSRKCCIHDDFHKILNKIKKSDLIIWSTPLFCYSVPSTLKAVLDRFTAFSVPNIIIDENGNSTHPTIDALHAKHVLISSSPLPDRKNCFDALKFQFTHMFGNDIEMILCAEKNLLKEISTQNLASEYFQNVIQAGRDFKEYGHILMETHEKLNEELYPQNMYIESINAEIEQQ